MNIQSDERRYSSSLPVVCSSRDRKWGVLQRHSRQQQSTDSAISENDDIPSSPSSATSAASSRLSLLHIRATPPAGHVTPAARRRCGMTLSGDDLFPVRMLMTTCSVDDGVGPSTVDDNTKHRVEPSKSTPETAVIHRAPDEQTEEVVRASGELERSRRLDSRQHDSCMDEDSGRSTSDDYTSDYEDRGATLRWRDESAVKLHRRKEARRRRSYHVTRRRRDVRRSHSDSVSVSWLTAKYRTGQDVILNRRLSSRRLYFDQNPDSRIRSLPKSSAGDGKVPSYRDAVERYCAATGQDGLLCQRRLSQGDFTQLSSAIADKSASTHPAADPSVRDVVDTVLRTTAVQHADTSPFTQTTPRHLDVRRGTEGRQLGLKNLDLLGSEGQNVKSSKRPERLEAERVNEDIPVILKVDDLEKSARSGNQLEYISKVTQIIGKNRASCTSKDFDLDRAVTTKGQKTKSEKIQVDHDHVDVKRMIQNVPASCTNLDLGRSPRSQDVKIEGENRLHGYLEVKDVSDKRTNFFSRKDRQWLKETTDEYSLALGRIHRHHSERLRPAVSQLPPMLRYIGHDGRKTTEFNRSRLAAGVKVRTTT